MPEPWRTERVEVERRRLPENEIADQAAGRRRLGQAEMAMAESIKYVRRPRRANDRQRIRQRRAKTHPLPAARGIEPRQEALCFFQHCLRALEIRRPFDAAKLDGAADAQPVSSGVMTKPCPEKISWRFTSKADTGSVVL